MLSALFFKQVKYSRVDTHARLCMKVKESLCKTPINCSLSVSSKKMSCQCSLGSRFCFIALMNGK